MKITSQSSSLGFGALVDPIPTLDLLWIRSDGTIDLDPVALLDLGIERGEHLKDMLDCIGCSSCSRVCPKGCLTHAPQALAA